MNISLNSQSMLLQRPGSGLKSTEEKQERQQKAQSQIDFFEAQKANLKNMKCETLEEIGRIMHRLWRSSSNITKSR